MIAAAIEAAAGFVILALMFVPLERLFTARPQPIVRPAFGTDALFFAGQSLVWSGAVVAALVALRGPIEALPIGGLRALWAHQPWALQAVEIVLLGDLVVYWGHRLSHRVPLLWRFHRVHHTAERLDWLAAFREHPLDGLYTQILVNAPALLLGFPIATIAGVAVFRGLWGVFIHSNTAIDVGPLKWVLGSPALHRWHHDLQRGGDCNYANLMPWLDWVFGTYHEPPTLPEAVGVAQPAPRSYVGLLLQPLGLWFGPAQTDTLGRHDRHDDGKGGRQCEAQRSEGSADLS